MKPAGAANPADRAFRLLAAYLACLGAAQALVIATALLRLPLSRPLAWLIFGLALGATWLAWRQTPSVAGAPAAAEVRGPLDAWARRFLIAALSAYGALWLLGAATFDASMDGNWYHLPTIHLWARRGFVHWLADAPDPRTLALMNGYPKGVELLAYYAVELTGQSRLVNCVNLLYLPLGVLGIAYLALALGAARNLAWAAGGAFVLLPVSVQQATTTYVDAAFAASLAALFAAAVRVQTAAVAGGDRPRLPIVAFGVALGLALGAKGSAAAIGAVAWFATVLSLWFGRSDRRPAAALGAGLGFLGVALLVGGYWPLRNWLIAGSPLYPVGLQVAGRAIFPGLPLEQVVESTAMTPEIMRGWPGPAQVLFTWAQGLWSWPSSILYYDSRLGGLTFLWLLGCVPAIIMALRQAWADAGRRGADFLRRPAVFLFLAVGGAFLVTPLNWWARFSYWIYALGLPCFAAALTARATHRGGRIWAAAATAVFLLEAGFVFVYSGARPFLDTLWGDLQKRPTAALDVRRWNWPQNYVLPGMRGTIFDEINAAAAGVAFGPLTKNNRRLPGQLAQPIGRREMVFLHGDLDDPAMAASLRLPPAVRYVILDDRLDVPAGLAGLSWRAVHAAGLLVLARAD